MKTKLIKIILICFLISTFPLLLIYFINPHKNKLLNNFYFKFPFILKKEKRCEKLQKILNQSLDKTFSASIINNKGEIIGKYNDNILRIPASNIKLFSTAYTLDKYNVADTLETAIYKDKYNNYLLFGSGDPDLKVEEILELFSTIKFDKEINIKIKEINDNKKWPLGWTDYDKLYDYGSPITLLATNSNSNFNENIYFLKSNILKSLSKKYPLKKINIYLEEYNENNKKRLTLINKISSNQILSLITLANSESHNFTAESLFKNASNTWRTNKYGSLKKWLKRKGLPVKNISITDASGLSRDNLITTNLIALFLHKMKFSSQFEFYNSSLSIIGVRGTLSNRYKDTEIMGRFFGKTGTLSNVFALSGYLNKANEMLSISIIQNSKYIDTNKVFSLLLDIYELDSCS